MGYPAPGYSFNRSQSQQRRLMNFLSPILLGTVRALVHILSGNGQHTTSELGHILERIKSCEEYINNGNKINCSWIAIRRDRVDNVSQVTPPLQDEIESPLQGRPQKLRRS